MRQRDAQVRQCQQHVLPADYAVAPRAAAVMTDGGRLRTRQEDQGRGVHNPGWREYKVCCLEVLDTKTSLEDPHPEPPKAFTDPARVDRLVKEIAARKSGQPSEDTKDRKKSGAERPRRPCRRRRRRARVRTVLASMHDSEAFGWQVLAEVQRRGLDRARVKGYLGDGQKYNWTIYEVHLVALGFVAILDVVHLVSYLYWGALACHAGDARAGWELYLSWLSLAWSGCVAPLLRQMRGHQERLGNPPEGCREDDPRRVLASTVGYVENNRGRMDYARYRKLGLPVSSASVESTIKRLNVRVKGTEKFWEEAGAEAILEVRAAYLSEDGRAERSWARPRPRGQAAGRHRLRGPRVKGTTPARSGLSNQRAIKN